jgi:predicted Zn-ribbon and HTH transcriptional regulator
MLRGQVACACGQLFGFETINAEVKCPRCRTGYKTADYGLPIADDPGQPEGE